MQVSSFCQDVLNLSLKICCKHYEIHVSLCRRLTSCHTPTLVNTGWAKKKRGHKLMTIILSNLNRLKKFHCTSRALSSSFSSVLARRTKCTRQPRSSCNFAKYSTLLVNFFSTLRLSNKPS